jgi:hypothetical protein
MTIRTRIKRVAGWIIVLNTLPIMLVAFHFAQNGPEHWFIPYAAGIALNLMIWFLKGIVEGVLSLITAEDNEESKPN